MALLAVFGVCAGADASGVGFQATFSPDPERPERVVSSYAAFSDEFSAALYPRTQPTLHRSMIFDPTLEDASFESNSLTFNTKFHRDKALVPVSVDAHEYLAYSAAQSEQSTYRSLFKGSLMAAQRDGRRQGVSIGVDLPKRFDRMFGEGGANLRVSGYRRITFSGTSQWSDQVNTIGNQQSKFPSLSMEQISRFDITGTIGSKISVKVSQDNQTDIPLANRLLIRYKGDDDDVLKVIEAGNTTLSIPNTRFVGYSARIQGLFGLKAEAQLGNLRLVAIASQEKGSSESATVSSGGAGGKQYIRDNQYLEGRIFDLGRPDDFRDGDKVIDIQVFELEETRDSLVQARTAFLHYDPLNRDLFPDQTDSILVRELDGNDFELYDVPNAGDSLSEWAIYFRTTRRKALGVYFRIARTGADTVEVGEIGETILHLKSLRAKEYLPGHKTWDLMWRNVYRIPAADEVKDLNLKVFNGLTNREGTTSSVDILEVDGTSRTYLEVFGLDTENNNTPEVKTPDGVLDKNYDIWHPEWQVLIFPDRKPFIKEVLGSETVPNLYDYSSPQDKVDKSKYYIEVSGRTSSETIQLGRANIIEGSERVTLNGRILQKDVDYTIQYDFGQVKILDADANDPNADVKVEFEYAPFLSLQKKTLFGGRAEYEFSKDFKLGTTVLYKSDKAQDRKPRVGQETAKSLVTDFDFSLRMYPDFITKAVDALPLVSTEAKSSIQIAGEIAQSRPNPNIDGVAYID
ncbi:MAG: cell surface protein SprA, partial [candidate division Zixibacteria bacterium]|nr:cell surface protein SprA [candidate division Zixibacteria bacterium]